MQTIKTRLLKSPVAVAVAVVVAVAVSLSQLKAHLINEALDNLTTVNSNIQAGLRRQINITSTSTALILRDNDVYLALEDILNNSPASSDELFDLRIILAEHIFPRHYGGFYLIGKQQHILASMKERDTGKPVPAAAAKAIRRLNRGEPFVITHAFKYGGNLTMWQLRSIMDAQGEVIGYLALALGKEHRFSATTLASGISYKTGETYLVDDHGVMLSESRFTDDLVRIGLIKRGQASALNIRVADPGVNLLTDPVKAHQVTEQPLTLAVRQALKTLRSGSNTDGYRDYRGVPVLGVWQWDNMLQAAIITKIDQAEAMDKYIYVRNIMLLLLLLVLAGSFISVIAYSRLRIRSERETNRHRNLLLESTAEAICGIGMDGNCTFVNRAFLNMLGYEEHEVTGKNLHRLIHHSCPDGSPYPVEACKIYKAHHEQMRIHRDDESFRHKDGREIKVEYWSQPMFEGDDVVGSVVAFLDITGKRKMEYEREQMEKQVQHSQRLESLGVLAGGIAHDFNNLLAAILGNASLVQSNVLKDPLKAKERAARIIQSAEKAGVLCRQMLAYSGKGQFILKPINLSSTVEEMTHLLEVSIEKSVFIKYHLSEQLPEVMVDEAQIQQVIMNLVTNANEAIEGKSGVISVTTGMMYAEEKYLAGSYAADNVQPGRFIYVEVSDTGCGMDEETIRKVFDPFFTTKVTGRGLGMSAVLGIVRGHGGALKVYSEPGRGTTFKFLLPVDESGHAVSSDAQNHTPLQHFSGGTALVVDDEETIREVACMMLEELGFETIAAADGEEGLALYRKHQHAIRFVLTDLTMPHMDGKELFTQLKQINPECRVILTSGYNSQEAIQQFSGKGLAGFIQKPYTERALSEEVKKILGGEL